jgi:hypothetical protein
MEYCPQRGVVFVEVQQAVPRLAQPIRDRRSAIIRLKPEAVAAQMLRITRPWMTVGVREQITSHEIEPGVLGSTPWRAGSCPKSWSDVAWNTTITLVTYS